MNPLEIPEIIGIGAFAVSGFFVGVKKQLDLFGIFITTFLTALGGGIVRDAIAQRPPYSFTSLLPGLLVVGLLFLLIIFKMHKYDKVEQNAIFVLSDAMGLSSFAISGVLIAIDSGFNFFGIIFLGLTTAVGGGVIRDILINDIPWILRTGLYGTVAILVGILLYGCYLFNILNIYTISTCFIFGVLFRLLAYYRSWRLPILL